MAKSPPIQGEPEKEIFVSIITKDISLEDAILDLVDNSVDAARGFSVSKHRENYGSENYEDLEIIIDFDKDTFSIEDNCGGFDTEVARNYAFRFGKADRAIA